MGCDYITKNGKIFFLDFIILGFEEDVSPSNRIYGFFKKIENWNAAPEELLKVDIKLDDGTHAFFKEIAPFNLTYDECSLWLEWEPFPNPCNRSIKALSIIHPLTNPMGAQLRGICKYLDLSRMPDFMYDLGVKLNWIYGEDPEGAGLSFSNFESIVTSALGITI